VRQPVEKRWKHRSKIRLVPEPVGPGKSRIGAHAERRRATTEATAQEVEQEPLAIVESVTTGQHASALADPCAGRLALGNCEYGVAHLWKQLNMLVAINEVGRAAEMLREGAHLAGDLRHQDVRRERTQRGAQQERAERQECAVTERAKSLAEREERGRQCYIESNRHAVRLCIDAPDGER